VDVASAAASAVLRSQRRVMDPMSLLVVEGGSMGIRQMEGEGG